ncbi:hypothetical protein HELRODRAFT_111074 [Helobdella robusta]|uniref:RNA methyltransferase n=1 Tax=Helobdella robusta TaxID=6412 RepID=T1EF76_HELRO|nr:hypothetical protein HELRODRAFT_111074 [Helobdella robusta]ESO05521.1 hypothetical protein HELRODRAFT_111074 [Helobdella robusta]
MSFQKQTKLNFRGKRKRSDSCKSSSLENCHVNKMMKTSYKSTQKYKKYIGNHSKGHPNGFSCNNNRAGRSVQNNNNHKIIVPNYFGGNARDPLNLNGLIACGGLSHSVTPMSSPMPLLTPHRQDVLVPVFRAANIYDPLNLLGEDTDDVNDQKARLHQRARKKRYLLKIKHKKQNKAVNVNSNNLSGMSDKNINDNMQCRDVTVCNIKETCTNEMNHSDTNATLGSTNETAANNSDITIKRDSSRETSDSQNFIKPVTNSIETSTSALASKNKSSNKKPEDIPTRASKPKRRKSINLSTSKNVIKYNAKSERYCHGNFNLFSSYKNSHYHDKRLDSLPRDKFLDKEVLEIGCNSGFVSIKLSKDFMAKKVLGVDINEKLVNASRSNLNYFSNLSSRKSTSSQPSLYPEHFSKSFGSMCHPLLNLDLTCHEWTNHVKDEVDDDCLKFPHNIHFKCADYVPTSQLEIKNETPQYDVIVALGVTKYIHLNYGDEGLKRTFQKIYRQLRPGGRFIMQAQRWSTYKKKKRINEETLARYKGIKLLPNTFKQYLISPEVGFSQYINWPVHAASTPHHVNKLQKGFAFITWFFLNFIFNLV